MSLFLHILAIIGLFIIICILGVFLRHSFRTQIKGLPPYINTYYKHRKMIREKLQIKAGSSVLDLGCGDGTVLRIFDKHFGCTKAVGYDIDGFAIRLGKILNRLTGAHHVRLIQDDMYHADVRGYDYIYLFLLPEFVADLEEWLFSRIDDKTIVICNTFDFVKHTPYEIIHSASGRKTFFFYKK